MIEKVVSVDLAQAPDWVEVSGREASAERDVGLKLMLMLVLVLVLSSLVSRLPST
jgi:hypothetical protein